MKTISYLAIIAIVVFASCSTSRYGQKNTGHDASQTALSNRIGANAQKMAEKEAKSLQKTGFYVEPAALPLEFQLEKAYLMESVTDSLGFPLYLMVSSKVLSKTPATAKQAAIEISKVTIAGYIQSHVSGIVKTDLSNNQLSMKDAEAINKNISVYNNLIAKNLGLVRPVAVFYRNVGGDKIEANVRLAYNPAQSINTTRNAIIKQLEHDTNIAREQLEDLLKLDRFNRIEPKQFNGNSNLNESL